MKPLWRSPFVGLLYTAGVFCSVTKLAHDPAVLTLAVPQLGGGGEWRDAAPSKGVIGTFMNSPPCPVGWSLATWPHLAGRRLENVLFIFHLQFMKQSLKNSSKKKKKTLPNILDICFSWARVPKSIYEGNLWIVNGIIIFNYYLSHHSQPPQSSWPLFCLGSVCVDDKLPHEFLTLLSKSRVTGDQTVSWCEWSCAITTL